METHAMTSHRDHFKEISDGPATLIFGDESRPASLITIAIPTYLRVSTLNDAIASAINQTRFTDYEIIVVDNNPIRNDETETLMEQYRSIPNLRYYKNSRNLGMTGNWNRLYELAKGDWVVMLHDDDMLAPVYLRTIAEVIKHSKLETAIFPTFTSDFNTFAKTHNVSEIRIEKIRKWHFVKRNYIGVSCRYVHPA